jgi:hypothetical protein
MSEELATVLRAQVPNHLEHVADGFFNWGGALNLGVDLVEHAEHKFAYFRIASDGFGCCELVCHSGSFCPLTYQHPCSPSQG